MERVDETFWSAHYARCQRYIYAWAHSDEFTPDELRRLSAEQRLAEGEFQRALSGRKNVAYPELCARVARGSTRGRSRRQPAVVTPRAERRAPRQPSFRRRARAKSKQFADKNPCLKQAGDGETDVR